jgi:hypothetical protein
VNGEVNSANAAHPELETDVEHPSVRTLRRPYMIGYRRLDRHHLMATMRERSC